MSLAAAERRHFQEEGWVMKPGVLDDVDLGPIRRGLHAAVDREAERARQEGLVDETFPDAPFDRRLALLAERWPDQVAGIMAPVNSGRFAGPEMFHTITHPRLLDVVEAFVGERIIGSSVYRVRPKLPRWERGEVPWHQDSGYFLPHCDNLLVLTCWIPLIDVSVENGCLWVVPRSHRNGVYRHYTGGHGGYLEIPGRVPGAEPIPVPMKRGDVLFLTNLTPHASFENHSDQVRWSLDLRYQGAEAPNNVGEEPAASTPERDPVTMACYPPEADFVIRDPEAPESECRTAEEFCAIREKFYETRAWMPGRGWTPLASRGTAGD